MFLGNMQSFYKRNSIHGQSPSHISQVKSAKGEAASRLSANYRIIRLSLK